MRLDRTGTLGYKSQLFADGKTSYYVTLDGGNNWYCVRRWFAYAITKFIVDHTAERGVR